jgi:hypothetical protein
MKYAPLMKEETEVLKISLARTDSLPYPTSTEEKKTIIVGFLLHQYTFDSFEQSL